MKASFWGGGCSINVSLIALNGSESQQPNCNDPVEWKDVTTESINGKIAQSIRLMFYSVFDCF